MIKEAIEKLQADVFPKYIEVGGRPYIQYDDHVEPVKSQHPKPAIISSLGSLVKFIADSEDEIGIVTVRNLKTVLVEGGIEGAFNRRLLIAHCSADPSYAHGSGFSGDTQSAVNWLVSYFQASTDRDTAIVYISATKSGDNETMKTDGVSYSVTVKTGPSSLNAVSIENPINLQPRNITFNHVDQPHLPFIMSLSGQGVSFEPGGDKSFEPLTRLAIKKKIEAGLHEMGVQPPPIYY